MKICEKCSKPVKVYRKRLCNNCYRKTYLGKKCLDCGKEIYSVCTRCGPCSREALKNMPNLKNLGKNNGMYKGGKTINSKGYHQVLVRANRYDLKHRLIMEKHLGRKLLPTEVVHHINQNKKDNRIENLQLLSGNSEHARIHWKLDSFRNPVARRVE